MKITYVLDTFGGGGKERRCLQLIQGLNKVGYNDIQVIIVNNEVAYKELYDVNIELHIIDRKNKKLNFFETYKQLNTLIKSYNPDIVQVWGFLATYYVNFIRCLSNFRLIGSYVADCKRPKFFSAQKVILSLNILLAEFIIGNSKAGLKAYGIPSKKAKVIYNGFDLSRVSKSKIYKLKELGISTPLIAVMVANVSPYKDYKTFIELAKQVTDIRDDVTFISIGKIYPEFKELTSDFTENKHPKIKFLGYREDIGELIKDCHLGILCTYSEGISNAIIELMANEIPVVTTDIIGGSSELIRNQVDGVICGNDEVVSETIRLLDNSLERIEMGKRAKLNIEEKFSLNAMVASYRAIYETF